MGSIRVTLELTPAQAAGLKRYAEKVGHSDALAVLYAHRPLAQRQDQASDIISAFAVLDKALGESNVASWPWVETGDLCR